MLNQSGILHTGEGAEAGYKNFETVYMSELPAASEIFESTNTGI